MLQTQPSRFSVSNREGNRIHYQNTTRASAYLYCGGGVLGEVDERAGVGDETGTDEFADNCGEVRGTSRHLREEVLVELLH